MPQMTLSAVADRAFSSLELVVTSRNLFWAISQTDMYLLHKYRPAAECENFEGDIEAAAGETPVAARNAAINRA
jgi:hypothetical protein